MQTNGHHKPEVVCFRCLTTGSSSHAYRHMYDVQSHSNSCKAAHTFTEIWPRGAASRQKLMLPPIRQNFRLGSVGYTVGPPGIGARSRPTRSTFHVPHPSHRAQARPNL